MSISSFRGRLAEMILIFVVSKRDNGKPTFLPDLSELISGLSLHYTNVHINVLSVIEVGPKDRAQDATVDLVMLLAPCLDPIQTLF